MIDELDAPLSPLVEDMLRPGLSFARSRSPRRGGKSKKKRRDQGIPTHRLVQWENADKWRNTNGPRNYGAERTNLSAGFTYLPHDTSESSATQSHQEPWTAIGGPSRISSCVPRRSGNIWIGRTVWRSKEHAWNTWTSCSPRASGPKSGIG